MNLTELQNPAADELIAATETLPVMADKRVVLVRMISRRLSSAKGADDGDVERIIEYLDTRCRRLPALCFSSKARRTGDRKLYTYCNRKPHGRRFFTDDRTAGCGLDCQINARAGKAR